MKVIAFNGSPKKEGNTYNLIEIVFEELQKEGITTELISLAGQNLQGCIACYKCFSNKNLKCVITTDTLNEYIPKILEADGVIIGSPTYFAGMTSNTKSLVDRLGLIAKANENPYKRKVGATVVAGRRAGFVNVFNGINHFFLGCEMIVPGSSYWNLGVGRMPGEVEKDEEGVITMKNLGKNMAWVLKSINNTNS